MAPISFIAFDDGLLSTKTTYWSLRGSISSIYHPFHFFVNITHSIYRHLHCEYLLQKDKVGGWSAGATWGSAHLQCILNFSIVKSNYGVYYVFIYFFQFALWFDCLECILKSRLNFCCVYIYLSYQLLVYVHIQFVVLIIHCSNIKLNSFV